MNKRFFKSKMVLFGDVQKDVADVLGVSEQTVSDKINGNSDFKLTEIKILIERYNLTPAETDEIFFGDDE